MKKKLLSLVLAGAMVASTSVSAFADSSVTNINTSDKEDGKADITITGQVLDNDGNLPSTNFNVTVPTTAAFTVTKLNNVISVPMTITNNGPQNIDVYAEKFIDNTPTAGSEITVVKENELEGYNRTYVSLNIKGKLRTLYLKSEDTNTSENNNGIYQEDSHANKATGENLKLISLSTGETGNITLEGRAGNKTDIAVANSVNNNFTLTLKIKKSAKK